jgi:hypothetical protein
VEAVLARILPLLLAALALSFAPAQAVPARCETVREGQAGTPPALRSFLAGAPDALLRVCRLDAGAARYELRGPRRQQQDVCSFDAVTLPGEPMGLARDLLAALPHTHPVYMRRAGACPPQDDPTYTRTETQYGLAFTDQFRWAMQAWGQLRADPAAFAAELSAPKGADPGRSVQALLARNRLLPLLVTAISAEAPSLRTLLHDSRVTLSIEAPEDPDASQRGATFTVTLEPTLGGFDVVGADVAP